MTNPGTPLRAMMDRQAQDGRVAWIGLRPARRAAITPVEAVEVTRDGLVGDHWTRGGPRAVTLIQWEHLPVIGAEVITPGSIRVGDVVRLDEDQRETGQS